MSDPWTIVGWLLACLLTIGAVAVSIAVVAAILVRQGYVKAPRRRSAQRFADRPARGRTGLGRSRS